MKKKKLEKDKKSETLAAFIHRRNRETGNIKITIPETRAHPLAAGRHPLKALQQHNGIVKNATARKMEITAHKRKKNEREGVAR